MSQERGFEAVKSKYPDISGLELHFYNMKYRGIKDSVMESGGDRPIFYIFDNANFGLISFMFSEDDSPYRLEKDRILFQEEELPFESTMFVRLGNTLPYYYFRGPLGSFPSLHDDNVLNVNFHPKCGGCDFCFYGYRTKQLENITPEQGFQKIVGIEDLDMFKKGAEALVPFATPHISIIRKTGQGANSLTMAKDYVELGPDHTCQIRKHYEELYGGRIIGNNFANIWLFPLSEFSLSSYLGRLHV